MERVDKKKQVGVLKLGGSFLIKDGKPDIDRMYEMTCIVYNLALRYRLIIVIGGGTTARNYINAASKLDASKGVCDQMGILVSRLNARLMIEALGEDCCPYPPENLEDVRNMISLYPYVVLGGLTPGQSTTAVAALCGEYCKAEQIVFATDVRGVYDKDPRKYKDAKPLQKVSYEELKQFISKGNTDPGQYRIMDGMGLTILERSNIKARIVNDEVENILKAFDGGDFGTLIC